MLCWCGSKQLLEETIPLCKWRVNLYSEYFFLSHTCWDLPHSVSQQILWWHFTKRLYSDRTEQFCGSGAQILTKFLRGLHTSKKMICSPSEPFLAIRVCQKCPKTKKHEKPGFWGNFDYISKTVKSIFMIFWDKTPLTNT